MQFNVNLSIAAILCFLPVAFVLMVIIRKRKKQREFSRAPFKELQRRPTLPTSKGGFNIAKPPNAAKLGR
jgi:hypothetical protein